MDDYHERRRQRLADLTKDQLIDLLEDASKNWLAHDGLWFLAVEQQWDLDRAIELDGRAWERFTVIEAKRIMKRHGIEPGGGIIEGPVAVNDCGDPVPGRMSFRRQERNPRGVPRATQRHTGSSAPPTRADR